MGKNKPDINELAPQMKYIYAYEILPLPSATFKNELCPGKGGTVTISTHTLKDFIQVMKEDSNILKTWVIATAFFENCVMP